VCRRFRDDARPQDTEDQYQAAAGNRFGCLIQIRTPSGETSLTASIQLIQSKVEYIFNTTILLTVCGDRFP
jgi:hypothetical protein